MERKVHIAVHPSRFQRCNDLSLILISLVGKLHMGDMDTPFVSNGCKKKSAPCFPSSSHSESSQIYRPPDFALADLLRRRSKRQSNHGTNYMCARKDSQQILDSFLESRFYNGYA